MPTQTSKPKVTDGGEQGMVTPTTRVDFNNGLIAEQNRVKEAMDKRYKQLVELLNKETSIGGRYDLKLRIEELQTTYSLLFK